MIRRAGLAVDPVLRFHETRFRLPGDRFATVGRDAIQNFLFQVSPRDPLTYIGVGVLLAGVSLFAIFVPARRATRVNPINALRAD